MERQDLLDWICDTATVNHAWPVVDRATGPDRALVELTTPELEGVLELVEEHKRTTEATS